MAAATSAAASLPGAAAARPRPAPLVAHGRSPAGQRWSMRIGRLGPRLDVRLSLPGPDRSDAGGRMPVRPPTAGSPLRLDTPVIEVGPGREDELDGIATGSAVAVRLLYGWQPPLVVDTRRPPARLRARYPYLRRLRLFVAFVAPRGLPRAVCALDARGRVLGCRRVRL